MRLFTLLIVALLAMPIAARATAQIPDEILIDGERSPLFSEPFSMFLQVTDSTKKLEPFLNEYPCSASWRGHAAFWEVRADQLVLVKLVANPCDERPKEIPLATFFPGNEGPVTATWYTGELVLPRGKLVQYRHLGYASRYERYVILSVQNGLVFARREASEPSK
ncbi:hypothetical protein ACFJGW_07530 [Burkholderiaceae bacterium UC74_6]